MDSRSAPIAYFCAEFGLSSQWPWYAGGLGILAGDTPKQAADDKVAMVGVGLLYRGEGSVQLITPEGEQQELDAAFDPVQAGLEHVYVDEMPLFIKVHLTEIDVWLRCWKKTLSDDVTLYLLDTDTDQNELSEQSITHILYAGTEETTIKQQLLLGIGGVKLLHALDIHPRLYHVQEGRPAFLHWQLIRSYMDDHGLSYEEAVKNAKAKTVYTNHTLVAAGNQSYDLSLLKRYGQYYADKMGVSVDVLLEPGKESQPDRFFITRFALNTSCKASGVSQLHTKLSEHYWPNYAWENVTNGVHFGTWRDTELLAVKNDPAQLWERHLVNKRQLAQFVQTRTGYGINPDHLIVTWSRRMAGYKRFGALFEEVERLKSLVFNADRPVQILMSGKAHKSDTAGKQQLQEIIRLFQTEPAGQALFIPNYDIDVAQALVKGSDVWLNTPEQGQEACGTSGMKALSNGVLQLTTLDGWTLEVDWRGLGWVVNNLHPAASVYQWLENEIIPMYYARNDHGVPEAWVTRMQHAMVVAERFSAKRMLAEYSQKLYAAVG